MRHVLGWVCWQIVMRWPGACPSVPIDPLVGLSEEQKQMLEKHGTPADFAVACYRAVPDFISMDEAKHAVDEYTAEWSACASVTPNAKVSGGGAFPPSA